MSLKELSNYTFYSRYSQYNKNEERRETWSESVERLFKMHKIKYADIIREKPELLEKINFAESQQKKKRVLAAQRSLQFAIEPILKHEMKMYNCSTVHINRERAFQEIMYVLLCGCGVGFSVQKHHIDSIGEFILPEGDTVDFTIEDSIEGWADAIGVLMASWSNKAWGEFDEYQGKNVIFDYSKIRPEGALIADRFKAPGPEGLKSSIEKIRTLLKRQASAFKAFHKRSFKLRPIDAYDCIMHISDAVLSGGVRRSATICMFSHDDEEMMSAKTGNWFIDNPQRARSNNSAALIKGEVSREEFSKLMKSTREFGEPGFIWVENKEIVFNPCSEIGMIPTTRDGRSGWQTCNLTEINGKFCSSRENFLQACEASAIIGTLQAGYTNFKYLTPEAKEIIEEEALLGCSITGWMDNPEILFDPELQREGAKVILETNKKIAELLNIKNAARATCVKPAGSTSCVLGTASGIHPHHARRYIRRVQVNKQEFCGQIFEEYNPLAVEESVWSANKTDNVISFLCEVPSGAIIKNQVSAIDLLEKVKLTQQNWVEHGTRVDRCIVPEIRHNVSNTCFSSSERFLTNDGLKQFSEFDDGDDVVVYDYNGVPRKAIVKNFGEQEIYKLVISNGKDTKTIETTKNHIWLGCNKNTKYNGGYSNFSTKYGYKMVTTDNLTKSKSIQIPRVNISQSRILNDEAFCHGFVFGDGSKHYKREHGSTHVKIFDNCKESLANIFKRSVRGCSIIENEDHIYVGKLNPEWKKLPENVDHNYIFSFISGWFAADGSVANTNDGQRAITITHKCKENIDWLYNKASAAGFSVNTVKPFIQKKGYNVGETYYRLSFVKSSMNDNFFINHDDKYNRWLSQKQTSQNSKFYKIESVIATGKFENVWCVVEPETSTFLLEGGILTHNCLVKDNEWDDVEKFIFDNQKYFAGISLLSASGDLDYPQAPFSTVLTPTELVREYGDASVFASGLIVDGLHAFEGNLWEACSVALGISKIDDIIPEPKYPSKRSYKDLAEYFKDQEVFENLQLKHDWARRVKQFSERYFEGDIKKSTYCLKHVSLWKTWCDLKREYVDIDWKSQKEKSASHTNADELAAQSCSGGACEISF